MPKKIALRQSVQEPSRMYCGPTIPGIAQHGMLFVSPPPLLIKCAQECPAINSFVIQPREYVHIKEEASRRGSFLNLQRRAVLEYLQGGDVL